MPLPMQEKSGSGENGREERTKSSMPQKMMPQTSAPNDLYHLFKWNFLVLLQANKATH